MTKRVLLQDSSFTTNRKTPLDEKCLQYLSRLHPEPFFSLLKCSMNYCMSRKNVVTEIRQYHGVVVRADKTIADAGREQIRAAFKCGQLLEKERVTVKSGHWGKFCERCGMSEDTAGRYIKLCKSADLRVLIKKYRTLNMAYQGEGITSPQRQRITIKTISTAPPGTEAEPTVKQHNGGGGNSVRHKGDGNNGVDLKAKVKGGGTLGDLLNKVPPAVRADIQSQLKGTANGGQVQNATLRNVAPVADFPERSTPNPQLNALSELGGEEIARLFPPPRLIEALLRQLQRCVEANDADEIRACVGCIKPVVGWYEKYAAKAEALAA